MDDENLLLSGSQASQLISEAALDSIDDPLDNFNGVSPYLKKAKLAKEKLKNTVKQLILSVDTQKTNLEEAKTGLSEADQLVGKLQGRLTMAKGFQAKETTSTSEKAFIAAIPDDERSLERIKTEQKEWKKRVSEASRVLQREEPNLKEAKIKLADFERHLDLIGISLENDDFPMSSTLANSTLQESGISSGAKKSPSLASCSTLLQVNDDCLMPTYESKAVIQKTPKKILQEMEQRLLFAPGLELDAELAALSELQSAILSNKDLIPYGQKVSTIKNQCQANRIHLDRLTLAQLLSKLLPMTARQTIHLSLVSLKNNPKLKKELSKPALWESRKDLGVLLKNERKFDISAEWKGRRAFTLKSCKPENQSSRGRGRGRGRGRYTSSRGGRSHNQPQQQQQQNQHPKPLAKLTRYELKRQGRCFNCRQKGHLTKDCPEKKEKK